MSMMGELTFFLGLQVKQLSDGIFINQSKCLKDILKKYSFSDSKSAKTPMQPRMKLHPDIEGERVNAKN